MILSLSYSLKVTSWPTHHIHTKYPVDSATIHEMMMCGFLLYGGKMDSINRLWLALLMTSTVTAIVSSAGIHTGLYFLSVGHASLLTYQIGDSSFTIVEYVALTFKCTQSRYWWRDRKRQVKLPRLTFLPSFSLMNSFSSRSSLECTSAWTTKAGRTLRSVDVSNVDSRAATTSTPVLVDECRDDEMILVDNFSRK